MAIKTFLRQHSLFVIYVLILLLVTTGLVYGSGTRHLDKVSFYFFAFTTSYFLFHWWFREKRLRLFKNGIHLPFSKATMDYLLLGSILFFIAAHLIFLGHVPFISAFKTLNYYKIAFIRQDILAHDNMFIKYMSTFMIKGIIPFTLLYFAVTNKKLFYFFVPFAIFYALALMQKSLIVSIMVPTVIYFFMNRNYFKAVLMGIIPVIGVFLLVYATNPSLRSSQEEIRKAMLASGEEYSMEAESSAAASFFSASNAIYTRVFLTTGMVAGYWFDNIPSVYPYAQGCGYHFLAPALGCNFDDYDYSRIIYQKVYVRETNLGLKGTVTVASFVYDYANFGYTGLFYSGILLGLFFILINKIFNGADKWKVSLNALSIFWLSSSAFTTLLLSGGWLLTFILFFIFRPYLNEANPK